MNLKKYRSSSRFLALNRLLTPLALAPNLARAQEDLPLIFPASAFGASGHARSVFLDLVERQQTLQRRNAPLDGPRKQSQRDGARRWPNFSLDGRAARRIGFAAANRRRSAAHAHDLHFRQRESASATGLSDARDSQRHGSSGAPRDLSDLFWCARSTAKTTTCNFTPMPAPTSPSTMPTTQQVTWERASKGDMTALRIGSVDQPVLAKRGDDLRIDWGYLYLAAPNCQRFAKRVDLARTTRRKTWGRTGKLPKPTMSPRRAHRQRLRPVAALAFNVGKVGAQAGFAHLDDRLRRRIFASTGWAATLRPYWRRNGMDALGLLNVAANDYASFNARSIAFDNELMADLRTVGGEKYARICGSGASSGAGGAENRRRCQRRAADRFPRKTTPTARSAPSI